MAAASTNPISKPQGLFSTAAERAGTPVTPPPAKEEKPAPEQPAAAAEDPFDSIFKIFNTH